jgi:hypothetical protein
VERTDGLASKRFRVQGQGDDAWLQNVDEKICEKRICTIVSSVTGFQKLFEFPSEEMACPRCQCRHVV